MGEKEGDQAGEPHLKLKITSEDKIMSPSCTAQERTSRRVFKHELGKYVSGNDNLPGNKTRGLLKVSDSKGLKQS